MVDKNDCASASGSAKNKKYVLTLYIASMNARTRFAIDNIKKICEERLEGSYDLEVVDLRKNPSLAKSEDIVATPTLVRKLPPPLRKFIGNMTDADKILISLQIKGEEGEEK